MAGGRLWRFPVVGYVWFCGPVVGCELVGLVALWFAMAVQPRGWLWCCSPVVGCGVVAPWLAMACGLGGWLWLGSPMVGMVLLAVAVA